MKKGIVFFIFMTTGFCTYAATEQLIWGNASLMLPGFKALKPQNGLLPVIPNNDDVNYRLEPVHPQNINDKHTRYQLTYKGLPIWGHQIIVHKQKGTEPLITGTKVTGIAKDLPALTPKISKAQVEKMILSKIKEPVKHTSMTQVIYLDQKNKAHLAWHLSFFTNSKDKPISAPQYLIDANTAEILKQWNAARFERKGQGLGGNAFPLPYRQGMFQHGDALPGLPSLGKFDVQIADGNCVVENDHIKVINLSNSPLGYGAFPITIFDEATYNLSAFSYPCDISSLFLNYADGITGPINYSFSPVNDTMYFAQKTLDMYGEVYGVKEPLGNDLPIRAYTHLGNMDNAFAIPTIKMYGMLVAHQQIVIGNGDFYLTAPVQSVIAHELSHNFTEYNSGLFYEGQSGGINESFSDMAAIALEYYLSKTYPWYWDGKDWSIGREAMLGGEPLRYMDEPTQDGYSISHATDFLEDMDAHYSSGVFNKAFYLLSHKPDYSIETAFQLMVDANQYYWSPIAYFDFAACGVIQAALDRKMKVQPVIEAFSEVGVQCPLELM